MCFAGFVVIEGGRDPKGTTNGGGLSLKIARWFASDNRDYVRITVKAGRSHTPIFIGADHPDKRLYIDHVIWAKVGEVLTYLLSEPQQVGVHVP